MIDTGQYLTALPVDVQAPHGYQQGASTALECRLDLVEISSCMSDGVSVEISFELTCRHLK